MKTRFAAYAAAIALSAATTVAAHAATMSNPARDRAENQITAQLNQQQAQQGNYGIEAYQGFVQQGSPQEQIAQQPDSGDLSIIE